MTTTLLLEPGNPGRGGWLAHWGGNNDGPRHAAGNEELQRSFTQAVTRRSITRFGAAFF